MPDENTTPSPLMDKKIMIVEDDKFIGDILLREALKNHKNCKLITSGEEAAEVLKKELPDILVLDIFLPGINGLDLLDALRKEEMTKKLPVMVVSNTDQAKDRERAKSLDAGFFLKAAMTPSEIIKEMENTLAGQN